MRGNEKNLIPNKDRSPEELREMTRKGGMASGKARREKRQLKELASIILNNKITDEAQIKTLMGKIPELDANKDLTWGLMLLLKQFEKAKDGDPKAFELLRDTSGQKPIDQQQIDFGNTDRIEIKIDGEDVE